MTTSTQRTALAQLLRRQDGVLSLTQARDVGISRESVARRVASKQWFRVGPRVYQVADHQETPRSRVFAATLSIGPHATLVGRSAAWWWRLGEQAPAQVEVAVAPPRQARPRAGADIRRRGVDDEDRTVVAGVAVTKKPATVLDAAVRLGLSDGARLTDRALLTGKVALDQLREVQARTSGRAGTTLARTLLDLAGGGARSEAERVAHDQLHAAGIFGWSPNVEIRLAGYGVAIGDIVFPAERVVIEVDGWAYHRDLRAFLRDGPRQTALAAAGWTVLRTHWYELHDEPHVFVAHVRAALVARSVTA